MTHRGKDLGLAARLAEALTKVHGVAGLCEGLMLLRRLVEEFWDDLTPSIEGEHGLEGRLAAFHWLEDPDRGALFPGAVRMIPLVVVGSKQYSWFTWRRIQEKGDDLGWKAFECTAREMTYDDCAANLGRLVDARAELDRLVTAVVDRSGMDDFQMPSLRQAICDGEGLMRMIVAHHPGHDPGPSLGREIAVPGEDRPGEPDVDPGYPGDVPIYSREQIYEFLGQLADMLQGIEPHSPVPYLLRRAVELGSLPFPQLMKELVKEPGSYGRMCHELGIKDVS
jgi:type VI secretion system protein ImpA